MSCQNEVAERIAVAIALRRLLGSPPGYQGFPEVRPTSLFPSTGDSAASFYRTG